MLKLPGRYYVDAIRVVRRGSAGILNVARLGLYDGPTSHAVPVALPAAFLSDTAHVREAAVSPAARLFEVVHAAPRAWVAPALLALADDDAVLSALGQPSREGIDLSRVVLARAADVAGVVLPRGGAAGQAEVSRAAPGRIDAWAEGPGLLVLDEGWDAGWRAAVDDQPARVLRVNHVLLAVPVPPGRHRVQLRLHVRGLAAGLGLGALGLLGLVAGAVRTRRA